MGLLETAALAPPQSGEALQVCYRPGTLRHGGRHAERDHESQRTQAQRLRDGSQMDVESQMGRAATGGVSGCGGPAIRGGAREDWRGLPDQRPPCRSLVAKMGRSEE